MSNEKTYEGACLCGAVQISVTGEPAAMGYCHCESCRSWSAGPINAFTLWQPSQLKITRGADKIGTYNQTAKKFANGGNLRRPFVYRAPALEPDRRVCGDDRALSFQARRARNYQETKLPMKDGLPKMKDFLKEMGGSGVVLTSKVNGANAAGRPQPPANPKRGA